MRIPSLAEELRKCERDYVEFVYRYCGRDNGECCKVAKVGSAEWSNLLEKHRLKSKSAPVEKTDNLSKAERIKMACGRSGATTAKILQQIGGSAGSLSVYLSQMKAAGVLVVTGQRGNYVYRVSA
jgi:DNA-binding CsgD family transcriptional regulator